ncbi:MAG: DNA mismatch repair endonuclease MutL [Candidatus Electrothrix sp. AW1]|nr:DNA mismatch repair endonuclease MutL [Candidatus Electrothrix sp. AX1]MCI5182523.1 DNA mismatch repair endonuclease MutL [Candidatus Electrothrix gigas]
MSTIRVLSDHLANQIAAGEVVERPASVVKELVENALDAGADRINIQVEGNGTRLIRVMDNGIGMDQDDVLLSLERHATSKLLEESQLKAITTLGFRGEALPSIGAVSRLSLLSRLHTAEVGTRAEVRYGALHDLHDEGCASGTVIEVRSLFGNLPARKKFLKTKRTELFHIEEVIRNQALARPAIAFFLEIDGRKIMALAAADQEQRFRDIFRFSATILDISSTDSTASSSVEDSSRSNSSDTSHTSHISPRQGLLSVRGLLLLPDTNTTSSARLRILVNNRPVQDRMIRSAVAEGLKGLLMKGQQPAGALLLDLDAQLVDINVHPAKREVRFRNPKEIRYFLVQAIADAVLQYQEERRSELFSPSGTQRASEVSPGVTTYSGQDGQDLQLNRVEELEEQICCAEPSPASLSSLSLSLELESNRSFEQHPEHPEPTEDVQPASQLPSQPEYSGLRLIGQLLQLYLLCEHNEQLVVIDQHAAHERILYQQLRTAYEEQAVAVQQLLFPVTVELEPHYADILEQEEEAVASLGLHVDFFGDTTWVIKGVPALVGKIAPQEVLLDILDGLAAGSGATRSQTQAMSNIPECVDNLLASMACKAAIKSGNRLHPEEMLALLQQMEQSTFFSHCPHGRPVVQTFSRSVIEKWFKRS